MDWAWEAEKTHAALYSEARAAVVAGNDVQAAVVDVCSRCGHTLIGEAPDQCPICKAKKELYRTFA